METVEAIPNEHVEGSGGGALLVVTMDVESVVVVPPVREPMDQPRVAMECEDGRNIGREQLVVGLVREADRMSAGRCQPEDVDHVHDAGRHVGMLREDATLSECLLRRDIAAHPNTTSAGDSSLSEPAQCQRLIPFSRWQHEMGHRPES